MVWACVGLALLGSNAPKEVISALFCVFLYSLVNKERSLDKYCQQMGVYVSWRVGVGECAFCNMYIDIDIYCQQLEINIS